jgi:hypothetical protein
MLGIGPRGTVLAHKVRWLIESSSAASLALSKSLAGGSTDCVAIVVCSKKLGISNHAVRYPKSLYGNQNRQPTAHE